MSTTRISDALQKIGDVMVADPGSGRARRALQQRHAFWRDFDSK